LALGGAVEIDCIAYKGVSTLSRWTKMTASLAGILVGLLLVQKFANR
jgi:hypothetical protein